MKCFAVVCVAIVFGSVLESASAIYYPPAQTPYYPSGPPIQVEDIGSGYSFLCDLVPAIDCDAIIRSLPAYSTKSDVASILSQLAATLTLPGYGGNLSQNPLQGSQITLSRLGGGYAFVCQLVPSVDCDGILQQLPAYATEGDAAAILAYLLAQLRFPGGAPPQNLNFQYSY